MAAHTILVVDDEPASLRALARAVGDEQPVLTAQSGAQALEVLAVQPIALMIVDQRMPGMRGTELLAHAARQQPEVIRVLLTGYTDIDTLVDAINAGHVYHYLTKPWEPQELRLVVRRGLERFGAEAERRQLLRNLEQACVRVQREADQKGRLLSLAAHELGTPLHVLSNALALIGETDPPPAARAWVDAAQRSAVWLGRGLRQMADAARWRRSGPKLQFRPLKLDSLIEGLGGVFEPIAARRNLALRLSIPAELPAVAADAIWLERAIANLLSNAVRFTPDGGAITVAVMAHSTAVEVSVTDTGTGIDASLHEEIFEPFSAASGDLSLHTSGQFEFGSRGLGLGLAITKSIIEQHGGTISVRSAVAAGTRFTLRLPRPFGDV